MTKPKAEICSPLQMSRFGWIAVLILLTPLLMRADETRSVNAPGHKESALDFEPDLDGAEMPAELIVANELNAVMICQGYLQAQIEYSHQVHDGRGKLEYAQRIMSSPGKQDGLYWNVSNGGSQPTVPKAFAEAAAERNQQPRPYHGYYFRVLRAQGPDAPSGKDDYVEQGSMIGGFALVAWPAQYSVSGFLTFIVNQDEVVYQKDLGPDTANLAMAMTSFDPDQSWDPIRTAQEPATADTKPMDPNSKYLRQISQVSAQDTLAVGVGSQGGFQPEADAAQKDAAQIDQALQHDVQQQLATSTSFQNVAVHASNGVVHLEGPVPSQGDKKRAVDLVKAVPGVTGVNENLTVDARDVSGATATADTQSNAELNPQTTGAALASQIAVAMHDEPSLANSQVNVTVKGDVIELTGTVPGKKERRKAKEVASAFAIHQHIVNKLTIAPRGDAKK
jgi:osmotically-inducible protein OsmY